MRGRFRPPVLWLSDEGRLVRVVLRNPRRELEVSAPRNVGRLLRDLEIVPESVLVIRNDTLATHDERLLDDDIVEIRPVTSGGAA
jgi:sulfur carrier protein